MMKKAISLIVIFCMILSCVMMSGIPVFAGETNVAVDGAAVDTAESGANYGLASHCKDGNILQCFNWTLSQIQEELPNIAAAGFTSVQTSPLQPHDGRNQWYWLYQPTNFTVGNELGSYSDLQSLCAEADRYGVKIIVDVVSNHVAGSDSGSWAYSVSSSLKKSEYFHNLGSHGSANDRYSTTQKNYGMPDLNSEHEDIQNMVYNYVISLKEAGVDGIRWDAAKHIALPSEDCGFWSKMAQIDIYQYGEILGNPADDDGVTNNTAWINEYAQYIGVSDTIFSSALMSAVRDGTTYKTTGYWSRKGVDAGKIVNWAESHDSYANEPNYGGWTKNLDQSVVDKAYAILGARANSQTLYLSRPSEKSHQSIYYGKKGSTHFTSKEIAAVNRFHNAMIGKEEKVLGSTGYYAVLRSGGAVIAASKGKEDTDLSVSNSGSMVPEGTYTDEVSGSTWTVTATKITGHIGSSGIAVIYDPGAPAEDKTLIGDADLNGSVEIVDASYVQYALAYMRTLTKEEEAAADGDCDGDITAVDVTAILRYGAGVEYTGSHVGEYLQ